MNGSMTEQGNQGGVTVKAVVGRENRSDFLDVPCLIHADDPIWIAPLRMIEAERLDPKKHPFYEHGEVGFWVAYKDGKPVGRISAQVDRLHLERYGDAMGHFGMVEAIDDPAVFAALFGAAEAWLRERGIERVTGPFNLSINEESGLLVDGFDTPPPVMTDHAKPYYGPRIEELGYHKAKDLYAFNYDFNSADLGQAGQARRRREAVSEHHDPADQRPQTGRGVSGPPSTSSTTAGPRIGTSYRSRRSETEALIKSVKPFVSPDYMWFADDDGRADRRGHGVAGSE